MKNIFFVDSENVGDSWIELFDYLNDEDIILVFYTDKSPNMSYKNLIALKQSPFFPEFIMCENGTENSLDFQLVTCLGSYTIKNPEDNLIIVSKDKGFDSVVHFWSNRGYNICRKAPSIFHTLSNESVIELHASSQTKRSQSKKMCAVKFLRRTFILYYNYYFLELVTTSAMTARAVATTYVFALFSILNHTSDNEEHHQNDYGCHNDCTKIL